MYWHDNLRHNEKLIFWILWNKRLKIGPPPRGCAGSRIDTRFLRPRCTTPLKGVSPTGTPEYRNGTESFFGLQGRPSVVRDEEFHN